GLQYHVTQRFAVRALAAFPKSLVTIGSVESRPIISAVAFRARRCAIANVAFATRGHAGRTQARESRRLARRCLRHPRRREAVLREAGGEVGHREFAADAEPVSGQLAGVNAVPFTVRSGVTPRMWAMVGAMSMFSMVSASGHGRHRAHRRRRVRRSKG